MATAKRTDFFRTGYYVIEQLERDELGASKRYTFAEWRDAKTGRVMAEVTITVHIGLLAKADNPIDFVVTVWKSVGTERVGRSWGFDASLIARGRMAPPAYVTVWLRDHEKALRHWRDFMRQYHR